jgi:uncharacterized repeat protein (TIGR03803 family)
VSQLAKSRKNTQENIMKNLTTLRMVSSLSLAFNRADTNAMLSRRFAGIDKLNWVSRASALFVLCVITAIAAPAQFNTVHTFDGTDGSTPYGALVQGIDGNLYGTTEAGGANGAGTVFKMTTGGTVTTIYNFCSLASCTDGANPNAGLVLDTDGNFYGTTFGDDNPTCGGSGCGTVFKITPGGTLTTLHSFCALSSCLDGANPTAGLVQGTDGNLYGTTSAFGKALEGTVFKISTSGKFTTLHTFKGTDGNSPYGGVIQGIDGNFYGTTGYGGAGGNGTVFKMTPTGTLTTLHSFKGADGANPYGGLIQILPGGGGAAVPGHFFGTTYAGGANGYGTIFEITPSGTLFVDYNFCSLAACADGANPSAGLVFGGIGDPTFYGTTSYGGASDYGTVFNLTKAKLITLYSFCKTDCADGSFPLAALVQDTNANLYGTTSGGGDAFGTVFSYPSASGPFVEPLPNYGKVGASIQILGTNLTGATEVQFGGAKAVFKVVSPSLITATVPVGALIGYVVVYLPAGVTQSVVDFLVTPQIKSFSPLNGKVGTSVVITGVSLTGTTAVTFGGVTATSFTVNSDTQVTATLPAAALTGKIAITTVTTATSSATFDVTPQITSFSPTSGPVGTKVTIKGDSLTKTTKVTFGGVAATTFKTVSNTEVTATVPTGAVTGDIEITTAGGTATSSTSFTVTP